MNRRRFIQGLAGCFATIAAPVSIVVPAAKIYTVSGTIYFNNFSAGDRNVVMLNGYETNFETRAMLKDGGWYG